MHKNENGNFVKEPGLYFFYFLKFYLNYIAFAYFKKIVILIKTKNSDSVFKGIPIRNP